MTKTEFLGLLETGLAKASAEERVAAIQYYTEYFDEAGPDHEAEVLDELGDPTLIAAGILAEGGAGDGEGWTPPAKSAAPFKAESEPLKAEAPPRVENPFTAEAPEAPHPPPGSPYAGTAPLPVPVEVPKAEGGAPRWHSYNKTNNDIAKIIVIILAVIVAAPVLAGLFGVLGGLLVALVVLCFVPIILCVSFIAAGVVSIVAGAVIFAASPGSALVAIGTGVFLLGLGLLCGYAGGQLLGKALPGIVRKTASWIRTLYRKIFKRSEAQSEAEATYNG